MIKITRKTKTIIAGSILIAALGYSVYLNIVHSNELQKFGRYTVGTTTRFTLSKDGRDVWYEFIVNGTSYKSSTRYVYAATVPGGRYLVKFSSRDPETNEIYLNKPVSLDINPPEDGWTWNQIRKR